jgi:hypothetical protein
MQSNVGGVLGRHLGGCHTFYQGSHVVGDFSSNWVYTFDFNTYTDNLNPITRIRQTPHVAQSLHRIFYSLLEIDFSPGTGLITGAVNAVDPRVALEISNDGGQTWSSPIFASIGKVGNYLTRARFQRLGSSRDRVFRVSCSDPVKFNLLSAQMCIELGTA